VAGCGPRPIEAGVGAPCRSALRVERGSVEGPLGGIRWPRLAPSREYCHCRTPDRACGAEARGKPRWALPGGFPAARRYTLAKKDRRQVRL